MTSKPVKTNWSYPTRILFGPGRIAELGEAAKVAGLKKPLLVTDPGLMKLPVIGREGTLKAAGIRLAVVGRGGAGPDRVQYGRRPQGVQGRRARWRHRHRRRLGARLRQVIAFMQGQTRPVLDFEDVGDWWTRANP